MTSKVRKRRRPRKPQTNRPDVPLKAMSISDFCRSYRIGRDLFYDLLRQGKGPATMLLGTRRLISYEAAEAWRLAREAETAMAV
jgi:excisionase family DNA binding protein